MRYTCDRLRRPAVDIGSLARGNPLMASRRIAPTTALRASARSGHPTRYPAAFGACWSSARLVLHDQPGIPMDRNLTPRTTLCRRPVANHGAYYLGVPIKCPE